MSKNNTYDLKYNLLLSLLSGIILGFSFPPFQFGIIALIGFVPLFILLESIDSFGRVFRISYFTFFVFNLIACYWVGGWGEETDIFLMLSGIALAVIHPFFFVVPILFFNFIRKELGKNIGYLSLPFLWVTFEYLHSITEFAFPWLILGNSQTYNIYNIQYITYTGVYGISFWILSMNVLIYYAFNKFIKSETGLISRQNFVWLTAVLILYFCPIIISHFIFNAFDYNKEKIKIAIIQPNIDPWEKWKKSREFSQVTDLIEMSRSVNAGHNPKLIIWPETAIPFYIRQPSRFQELKTIQDFIDSSGAVVLSGAADLKIYSNADIIPPSSKKSMTTGIAYDSYNSIFLFQPKSDLQIYHKIRLVPFSERIPYLDSYPFLVDFLEWGVGISNWGIGKDSTIFSLNKSGYKDDEGTTDKKVNQASFWAMICYESIFPGFVSEFVQKGAQFLVIVTNDSWFGNSPGPYQHNQIAVLRAIENRRSIARCANGGISSIIDPVGRITAKTKFMTKDVLVGEIYKNDELTFYSKHGDLFARICLYISVLFLLWLILTVLLRKHNNKVKL